VCSKSHLGLAVAATDTGHRRQIGWAVGVGFAIIGWLQWLQAGVEVRGLLTGCLENTQNTIGMCLPKCFLSLSFLS
jgi:hypothetical protein